MARTTEALRSSRRPKGPTVSDYARASRDLPGHNKTSYTVVGGPVSEI